MKIDALQNLPRSNSLTVQPKNAAEKPEKKEDFSQVLNMKKPAQAVELPKTTSREMIQDFAEWYFKQGKSYESIKSYKQAISAYERAYSTSPDINKSQSIDKAREKAFKADGKA